MSAIPHTDRGRVVAALREVDESRARWFELCCNVYEAVSLKLLQAAHCEHHLRLRQLEDAVRAEVQRG